MERRNGGLLVIGDDSVSSRALHHLGDGDDMIYVGVDDWKPAHEDESVQLTLEMERIIDLLRLELDIVPSTALVATSEDSKNLLLAVHLRGKFRIEDIVVRVNDPQYVDAFADLSFEVVDVASIVGAALAENLQQANDPL